MSPATTMDTTLPSSNSALYNIPQLAEDGSNWIMYKQRATTVIGARGLMWYLDGCIMKPVPYKTDSSGKTVKPDGSTAMETKIEELEKKIDEYYQKDSLVKQHIFSTISDWLLLQVQNLDNASKIWEEVHTIHECKTELVQIDLRRQLQETQCEEGGDIKAHFGELLQLRESLAGMGVSIDDKDFLAIIIGSLSESYRPLLSSINAAAQITKKLLTPYELVNVVSEEYEHRQLMNWCRYHNLARH